MLIDTKFPKCWCHSCWDEKGSKSVQMGSGLMHFDKPFIVCPDCGNKRCPKATHHNNKCTGSNEIGQKGSIYGGLEDSKESS